MLKQIDTAIHDLERLLVRADVPTQENIHAVLDLLRSARGANLRPDDEVDILTRAGGL